ncbi:phage tail protein [Salmonella enterica]|nr:phage tail protein [Salmonella enterica]ELF3724793.1 phage tail protein [Salmonella enterica]
MKGLENAVRNLNSLDTRMVPQASAWAINRVAGKIISQATRQVAQSTVVGDNQVKGIPLKLVRGRVRLWKASPSGKMYARLRINRGNLPAVKLGRAQPLRTRGVGRQLFLHGSEMLQTHRQVNNDAAYGRFGDFALR